MTKSKRNKLPFYCELCGQQKNVLIHHKDRNRNNNSLQNLQILCASCHAIEHTRIANIKKMRWYYKTHKEQLLLF